MSEPSTHRGGWRHGTNYGYIGRGCRCEPCRAAASRYRKAYRASGAPGYLNELVENRRRKQMYRGTCESCGAATTGSNGPGRAPKLCADCYASSNEPAHGTLSRYSGYKWKCRCDKCRAANAAHHREYMRRRREAVHA